jgi:NADPH:quinone reductase-like Zn-dependent oxidoreductase
VQLSRLRSCHVIAQCATAKSEAVRALGADTTIDRDADLREQPGEDSVDVVVDLVAGPQWPALLATLRRGGRYVTAGAIAGPRVELDLRRLYLRDLVLHGCAAQTDEVFEHIVRYLDEGRLQPVVAARYALRDLVEAQRAFMAKRFVGKIAVLPEA